ncbi:isoprenyl transferase [Aerococcaceae bacterium WGS1372]
MTKEFKSVPNHVAFIMDGNGRWAKKRFLPRVLGHRKGVQTIKNLTIRANEIGIKIVTLYAFSTENWGRPKDEVKFLMQLPKEFFDDFLPQLIENNIKLNTIGDIDGLPDETKSVLNKALEATKNCSGMILNFAINYGSRQEIVEAVKHIVEDVQHNNITADDITESLVNNYLMTAPYNELADPDLIIRTSGEQRISNFLLWQAAYSEFYFTDTLWPDFTAENLDEAIDEYNNRQRRFGKVDSESSK